MAQNAVSLPHVLKKGQKNIFTWVAKGLEKKAKRGELIGSSLGAARTKNM